MNIVKQHIREKFNADSDPIRDMGIGLYSLHTFETNREAAEFLFSILYTLSKESNLKKFVDLSHGNGKYINSYLWNEFIYPYKHKYIKIINNEGTTPLILRNIILSKLKEGIKTINEKFTKEGDPITDLGIGIFNNFDKVMKNILNADKERYIWALDWSSYQNIIEVFLNIPKISNTPGMQSVADVVDFVEKILESLDYSTLYKLIIYDDKEKFEWKRVDPDMDLKILTNVPEFFIVLNNDVHEQIQQTFSTINIVRRHDDNKFIEIIHRTNESVNEAFTEDSDPIKDLGIGLSFDKIAEEMREIEGNLSHEEILWACCKYGKKDYVIFLLETTGKKYIHYEDEKCLHVAILTKHYDVVKLLLKYGADALKNRYNGNHASALDLANRMGDEKMIKIIKSHIENII